VPAIPALAAAAAQPGHTHPLSNRKPADPGTQVLDNPDDLVAGHQGQGRFGKLAVDYVQVRSANTAGRDLQQ